jgi:SAM-dependent methyltransferase
MELITFKDKHYPKLQAEGFASQYAFAFANKIINPEGKTGYDIGCKKKEWALPGAIPVDPILEAGHDAFDLPAMKVDYIFSSHCLEHLPNWTAALEYWHTKLHEGGILFLYLPHPLQEYWWPHNNKKHLHILFPDAIAKVLTDLGYKNIFVTGHDLNHSFYAIAEK